MIIQQYSHQYVTSNLVRLNANGMLNAIGGHASAFRICHFLCVCLPEAIFQRSSKMVDAFFEVATQGMTIIPGGPFPHMIDAHIALEDHAILLFGTFRNFLQRIEAYGFTIHGNPVTTIRVPTLP